jgi:hypothetical protein
MNNNRYKIKVVDLVNLKTARQILNDANIHIFVDSEKRLFLSVGELPESIIVQLEQLGNTIVPDTQYAIS